MKEIALVMMTTMVLDRIDITTFSNLVYIKPFPGDKTTILLHVDGTQESLIDFVLSEKPTHLRPYTNTRRRIFVPMYYIFVLLDIT
jgi:hypothetical protein